MLYHYLVNTLYFKLALKEERLKQSTMKKWRLLGIVLVAFIVGVVGCPETQQMMKPIVTEPADTVLVGEMKEEPEEKPAESEGDGAGRNVGC